jgi:hypothetical protein
MTAVDVLPAPAKPNDEPSETAAKKGRRWYGVGVRDLTLIVLAVGIGQTASRGIIADPGLGWHLRTPDVVFSGGWPIADPFSGPDHGHTWLANQWLGDVLFWAGWKAAGMNGVTAVTLAGLLLAYRLLYGFLRADGVPWPAAAGWTLLAALASYYAWVARPNLVTILAVTVLARVLTLFHEGRWPARRLLWLPLLFVVWVNSHGGFVAGLAMIVVGAAVEFALSLGHPEEPARAAAGGRLRVLAATGVGCGLATMVNPYGWRIYPWVFSLLGDPYFMNMNEEWLSPDFHLPGAMRFELLMALVPALFAVSRYRPNLILLALALFWFHFALQGRRYVPLWVMVTTPLAARAALQIDWVNARFAKSDLREMLQARAGGWLGFAIMLAGLAGWAVCGRSLVHDPAGAAPGLNELLRQRQPGEVVLHSPNFGGYLTLNGWPDVEVWIDDRNEVHGRDGYEGYFALEQTQSGWEAALAKYDPKLLALPPDRPLSYRLAERPSEWDEVFRDDCVVVFRRRAARSAFGEPGASATGGRSSGR